MTTVERPHKAERLAAILEAVERSGSVSVARLAAAFAVSPASLRRDLRLLQDLRLLERTHGGAVARATACEVPLPLRKESRLVDKQAIGRAAAALVPDCRAVVALNGGTTTLEVARALDDRPDLIVVTNSLDIARVLLDRRRLRCFLLGGQGRGTSHETVGRWTVQFLTQLTFDLAFLGADGLSALGGLTTHNQAEATTNRSMIERARRSIAVVDSRKIGRVTPARIAPLSVISGVVTDDAADSGELAGIRSAGCAATIVPHQTAAARMVS
jgi:DeoR family transcriptional regulator of aga operon